MRLSIYEVEQPPTTYRSVVYGVVWCYVNAISL